MRARLLALRLRFATWRIEVWNARAASLRRALAEIMGSRA